MFCRRTWLISQSSRFTYNRRLIKFNENNVRARKLNEPVGFLVSSLNKLVSTFRQRVKSKEIQQEKKREEL